MTLTLRTKATAMATLLCSAVLVLGSVLLVTTLDSQLTSSSDDLARSRVRDLLDQAAARDLPSTLRNVNDDSVAQIISQDGTVLSASANIQGEAPIVAVNVPVAGEARTISGPDDQEIERYRVWVQSGGSPAGGVTVVEGMSLESVSEATSTLRRTLSYGGPLVLVALATVMWLVVSKTLARLDKIRAEVDSIGPDKRDHRLPDDGRRDEVGRLATTMNRMLARMDASAQRQRRLVADVSHDLQGPLAAQRLSVELALAPEGAVDVDVLREDVLGATSEMERLVSDLLVVAVADEGPPPHLTAVDLDTVVLEEAARARHTGVVIETSRVSAGPVLSSPDELRRIVRNLLDNAVTHARSRIELRVVAESGQVRLDVVDDGPGIPDAERDRVFERFHRGDPARTRGAPGTGLGLAIARGFAERAGGSIELVDEQGPGAVFRLTLPILDPG